MHEGPPPDYHALHRIVAACLEASRYRISEAGLRAAEHYHLHDEIEMAFEGLIIELIIADATPKDFDGEFWERLAIALHLDQESVFDADIWPKFLRWVASR